MLTFLLAEKSKDCNDIMFSHYIIDEIKHYILEFRVIFTVYYNCYKAQESDFGSETKL